MHLPFSQELIEFTEANTIIRRGKDYHESSWEGLPKINILKGPNNIIASS